MWGNKEREKIRAKLAEASALRTKHLQQWRELSTTGSPSEMANALVTFTCTTTFDAVNILEYPPKHWTRDDKDIFRDKILIHILQRGSG